MADAAVALPEPRPEDDEDVVWGLSTASTLWKRGERADAVVWLRRASDAAAAAGQQARAAELGMAATQFEQLMSSSPAAPNPAPPSAVQPAPTTPTPSVPPPPRISTPPAPRVSMPSEPEDRRSLDRISLDASELEEVEPPPPPRTVTVHPPAPLASPSRTPSVAPPPASITAFTAAAPLTTPTSPQAAPAIVDPPPPRAPLPSYVSSAPARKSPSSRTPILDPWAEEPTLPSVRLDPRTLKVEGDELMIQMRRNAPRPEEEDDGVVTSAAPLVSTLRSTRPSTPAPRKWTATGEQPPGHIADNSSSVPSKIPSKRPPAPASMPAARPAPPAPPSAPDKAAAAPPVPPVSKHPVTDPSPAAPAPPAPPPVAKTLPLPPTLPNTPSPFAAVQPAQPPAPAPSAPASKPISSPLVTPPPSTAPATPAAAAAVSPLRSAPTVPIFSRSPASQAPPPPASPLPPAPAAAAATDPYNTPTQPSTPSPFARPRPVTVPPPAPAATVPSPQSVVKLPAPARVPAVTPSARKPPSAPPPAIPPAPKSATIPRPAIPGPTSVRPPPPAASQSVRPPAAPVRPSPVSVRPPPPAPSAASLAPDALENVDAFADLPPEMRAKLASLAKVEALSADEEVSSFGAALLVEGTASVCAAIVDEPISRAVAGTLLPTRGTLPDSIALRAVAGPQGARMATWDQAVIDEALRSCPWVIEELTSRADRLQALAGATMGPLGELDEAMREKVIALLEVGVAHARDDISADEGAFALVCAGTVDVVAGGYTLTVRPGEQLFPYLGLQRASAGALGALLLTGDLGKVGEAAPSLVKR